MRALRSPQEKAGILGQVHAAMKNGASQNAACAAAGISPVRFMEWRAKFEQGGVAALAAGFSRCGRKALVGLAPEPKADARDGARAPRVVLSKEQLRLARKAVVEHGSMTLGLRMFATSEKCPQEVADVILARRSSKHKIPPALRALVAVPNAVHGYHTSPRQVRLTQFVNPRTLTYLDAKGEEKRILPGDVSERDDMSNNFIGWVNWPWGGDPCSEKFGVRIFRGQLIPQIDVASLYFQSFCFLVRLRDSYRADDIWQWVGQTYRDIGLPRIGERWERGIWQAHKLQGVPIEESHTAIGRRIGGLQALGRTIIVSQSPTTKIIENRFSYLQKACRNIHGQIGRTRGEFERENKLWTECREGRRDPRNHFLSFEQLSDQIECRFSWVNNEPVEGSIYKGIPADIYQRGLAETGGLQRLTAEQTYLFSRAMRAVTVTKGHVHLRKADPAGGMRSWWFHHADLWRYEGRKVVAFLDDQDASAGATVVQAQGEELGNVIGHAELVDGTPQFAIGLSAEPSRGADAAMAALARRKEFADAVRSEYRTLGIHRRLARSSEVRDGAGGVARVTDGAPAAAAVLPTPRRAERPEPAEIDAGRLADLEAEFARNNPGVLQT